MLKNKRSSERFYTRCLWSETLVMQAKSKGRKPQTQDPDKSGLTTELWRNF